MWSGSEAEAFQTVIDDFNASQDEIQVEVLASQTEEKMLTAIPSGDGPDIVHTSDTTCSKWAQAGLLSTLTVILRRKNVDVDDIYPSVYASERMAENSTACRTQWTPICFSITRVYSMNWDWSRPRPWKRWQRCVKGNVKDANGEYTRLGYVPDYPWIDRVEIPYLFGAEFYDFETIRLCVPVKNLRML